MKIEHWEKLDYSSDLLGPGHGAYSKRLPNGYEIIIDDADEEETMPKEHGPFRIGLYNPPVKENGDMIGYIIIGNDNPSSAKGKLDDCLLISILEAVEANISELS